MVLLHLINSISLKLLITSDFYILSTPSSMKIAEPCQGHV